MNGFDSSILLWFNQFSQSSQLFNQTVECLANNDLIKGVLTLTVFWWMWFWPGSEEEQEERRRILLANLAGALLALLLGRILQIALPFRPRPMNNAALGFALPLGVDRKMGDMSSFPSDHAALFFSLATGFVLVRPLWGGLAFLQSALVVCLPRLYLGFHYPTDVLVGAVMGIVCVLLCNHRGWRDRIIHPAWMLLERRPDLFYAGMFFLSIELATLFDSIRDLGSFLVHGKH